MATRVYEFSKKFNISSKELLKVLSDNGFEASSHMSALSEEALNFLNKKFSTPTTEERATITQPQVTKMQKPTEPLKETPKPQATQTQSKQAQIKEPYARKADAAKGKRPPLRGQQRPSFRKEVEAPRPVVQIQEDIYIEPMTVADFARKANKPVSDVILHLLKQKIVVNRNQVLSEKMVSSLVEAFELKAIAKAPVAHPAKTVVAKKQLEPEYLIGKLVARPPVIVVIGHVDHGKTTLLDYIRKTRVALKEKGGITQHLGAYEAETAQGKLVFLDTPGHEAFSLIRVRGVRVADVAVLVVAADDGVMPQTIEAINLAQKSEIPLVVAINKIDKATPVQVESTKRALAAKGVIPEVWGGQTVFVEMSAKSGLGVDELLDVLTLQSQIMELQANISIPAQGFILESKIEKGRGPVATVICQHGILKIGDHFVSGAIKSKVSSLVDSQGKRVQQVEPSIPVLVAGFDELPNVGDEFKVLPLEEWKKYKPAAQAERQLQIKAATALEKTISILIKADNQSSLEALINAVEKLSTKAERKFNILNAAVGSINESDVELAKDTGAIIYCLHVKLEPNASALAARYGVSIKCFDIIYKLLEEMEQFAATFKEVKMVSKKIGEASVLKTFDIKGLGVIAGSIIKSGKFNKDGKVIIFRGKHKIGQGPIISLQRERKSVKEVHSGFECGILVEGFNEWQQDDRVECYMDVPA